MGLIMKEIIETKFNPKNILVDVNGELINIRDLNKRDYELFLDLTDKIKDSYIKRLFIENGHDIFNVNEK